MLGDNAEKSRNPLKKAMRRRNAKTVTFSAPTFIEASDVEFSTDDELDEVDYYNSDEEESSHGNEVESQDSDNRDIVVAPLRPKPKGIEEPESVQTAQEPDRQDLEGKRSSEESSQPQCKNFRFPHTRGYITYGDFTNSHSSGSYRQQVQKWYCTKHGFILQR